MAVYGYARVSTAQQVNDGESLEVQQRQIAGYCMMKGMPAPTMIVEGGVSGTVPLGSRPEGKALLERLRKGDVIVASKLDRMFRSANDALATNELFEKRGISLVLIDVGGDVTHGTTGRLFFMIVAAFGDSERRRIGERAKQSKADRMQRGLYTGGKLPFGYVANENGQLVEDAAQQAIIGRVRELHEEGTSYRRIMVAVQQEFSYAIALNTVMKLCRAQAA